MPRVDEDILAAHAFLSLETSCSPSRKNGDKVNGRDVLARSVAATSKWCLFSGKQNKNPEEWNIKDLSEQVHRLSMVVKYNSKVKLC